MQLSCSIQNRTQNKIIMLTYLNVDLLGVSSPSCHNVSRDELVDYMYVLIAYPFFGHKIIISQAILLEKRIYIAKTINDTVHCYVIITGFPLAQLYST